MTELELESSTAIQPPTPPPAPYRIYVSFTYGRGKRRGFDFRILNTPFPDLDTQEAIQAAVAFLSNEVGQPDICILFWNALEG